MAEPVYDWSMSWKAQIRYFLQVALGLRDSRTRYTQQKLRTALTGSRLEGLSEIDGKPGNLLLFSSKDGLGEVDSQLEVNGSWSWSLGAVSSATLPGGHNTADWSTQDLHAKCKEHTGNHVVNVRLWPGFPHLAIEFSDRSLLVINGHCGPYESWGYTKWHGGIGIYAMPGGPVAVFDEPK